MGYRIRIIGLFDKKYKINEPDFVKTRDFRKFGTVNQN